VSLTSSKATVTSPSQLSIAVTAGGSGDCPMLIVRTFMATDDCGNSVTATQIITVIDNTPPVLSGVPQDTLIECDGDVPPPPTVTAFDN